MMTARKQLLEEIERSPDEMIEALLEFLLATKAKSQPSGIMNSSIDPVSTYETLARIATMPIEGNQAGSQPNKAKHSH